jgi:hypothetical protein
VPDEEIEAGECNVCLFSSPKFVQLRIISRQKDGISTDKDSTMSGRKSLILAMDLHISNDTEPQVICRLRSTKSDPHRCKQASVM